MKTILPWIIGFIAYIFLMLVAPLTQFGGWFPSLKSDHYLLLGFLWVITVLFALLLMILFIFGFALFLKIADEDETIYDNSEFLEDTNLD